MVTDLTVAQTTLNIRLQMTEVYLGLIGIELEWSG